MCDVCTDLLNLLDSHEEKIQGDGLHLSKGEILTVILYAQAWSQRQCMCCFREVKNFERLNDIVQVILSMSIKIIETIPSEHRKCLEKESNDEKEKEEKQMSDSGENEKKSEEEKKDDDNEDNGDDVWTIDEKDKLMQFVSKLFLMNFPLYMAYKHMVHEEINPQEANALGNYCEVADTEVPLYLLRNVCFFCDTNGIQAIATCFDNGDPETLPFFVAHTLITIIANLRMWMNIPTIMQCIVPLRSHIIRYMCKLSDKDLRMAGLRNMTDLLWAAVKEPLDSQVTFDHEVLDLAFKYFTCSTLTIRLAGVSQMNNQINIYNENCNNESTTDAESIGNKIANWLIDNKLVEHIFGPNLHVEIIKQCQMILNFLAVESRIINEHIDCIWAAAQLKHCSKQVHDILMTLIKNLHIERVQHLLKLVSSLEISAHTEQTLYLAYALIKRVWISAGGPCPHITQQANQSPQYSGAVKEHEEFSKVLPEGVKDSPGGKLDADGRKRKHHDEDEDEAKVPEDSSSSCEKKKCLHHHEGEDWDHSSICANSDLSNISDDSLPSDISDGERCYHRLQKRKEQQRKGQHKVAIEVSDCESEDTEDPTVADHHHHHGCSHHHKLHHHHHHHHHKHVVVEEDDEDDDDLDEDEEEMDSEQEEIIREIEMVHAFHTKNGNKMKTRRQLVRAIPGKGRGGTESPRIVIRPVRPVKVVKLVKESSGDVDDGKELTKDFDVSEDLISEEASVSVAVADEAALLVLQPKESEEGSLLEEDEDEEEGEIRKTKEEQQQESSPTSQEFVGSSVETEVYDYLQQFQAHRHRHLQGDFMEDILSPDDGSCNSSHISNKSEKNMADFEGEDVMSDEEVAHIHGNSCVPPHMRAHAQFRSHVQQELVNIASMYHAHGQVPHGLIRHDNDDEDDDDEEHVCSSFSYEDVCKPGHTLLWDLVQEDNACQLPEGLDAEAEKALFSLVCYSTDRRIRMKFIGACIDNLANNTSVVVSLRFLPKLLGSFQQYRSGTDPYSILIWAENKLSLMKHFFNNLVHFSESIKDSSRPVHSLYSFRDEVQVRLQFLTGVFSSLGSPDTFRLSIEQVDTLWSCLVINPASTDECLSWFLSQAKSKDHHALGLEAFKHIFLQKMPQLEPENISMIGLNLFQQLCHYARQANNSFDNPLPEDEISGMDQLWGIALKADNTDVSMSAIQYLNNYYIMYDKVTIGKEEEFIQRCMESLHPELTLLVIQRALILLKNHLESFRRRYAFHLRMWQLDSQGIISHQKLLQDRQSSMLRIVLQPAGLAEKQTIIEMLSSDLVAELRAEVTRWWEFLQKQQKTEKQTPTTGSILTPILGSMLGDGPVRMITLGQELTVDMDEKSLLEIQFKDRQLVFVSVGVSRHPRKQDESAPVSYQTAPKREQIPMMILLQEEYFEHLFNLLQKLSNLQCPDSEVNISDTQESYTVESKARLLSHKVWELLMLLPTSHSMLDGFKNIIDMKDTQKSESNSRWNKLLNCDSPHKLMYSLQIVESISRPPKHKWKKRGHSGGGDYLPSSDSEDTSDTESNEESWSKKFVAAGGLSHMFHIFLSGCLQSKEGETWNEWNQECLGYLLRLISQFSISQDDLEAVSDDVFDQYDTPRKKMKKQKSNNEKILIPRLNETILSMMEVDAVMKILTTILHDAAVPSEKNQLHSSFARAEVVHYALSFLVSWAYSCEDVQPVLCSPDRLGFWLKRLTLDAPEPHVRREACMGLYRLCHGQTVDGSMKGYCFLLPLLSSLLTFLDYAKKMKPVKTGDFHLEDGKDCPKEPYGAGCRDYFWLVCRLVESITKEDAVKSWEESGLVDLNSLASHMANAIMNKDYLEPRINTFEDDALIGLLQLGTSIMKHSPPFKSSEEGRKFMVEIFWCLFSLPSVNKRHLPKCKSDASRSTTYDLLIELVKGSYDNYVLLHKMVLTQHSKEAHAVYPWDHWPHDDGRSNCGYVGLTNLGATCYMATCMQHLYMIPRARESVLQATVTNDCGKYEGTLTELKKMFAYLLESERKAYNPRGFCKVYTMDKQPLNTGEQKDMTEFFTDLISKLEEMSPELKNVVKTLFGGVLSNNVVSLDCPHVSRTLEEFYTVRCQVADMKNLYESLDEVTVKDTLEGDNMYTCSKCQKKVRAEKRACFKSLPKILCFNTMRYTFNMVTMMKEKVNTHFSFPLRLSMQDYMEHNLIQSDKIGADDEEDDEKNLESVQRKDPNEESYEYELTGVTVHTGTADGGHYYSFIRDRLNQSENGQDKWFLFNDAEVKSFDPGQIAGECFGGEMTSKTYDSVTDKFMDFSFEKTNSAYMLFYERIPKNMENESIELASEEKIEKFNFELSKELADWIWQDNMQFLQDKNIFEHTYFGFMWQMCGYIPTTLPRDEGHQVPLLAAKLSASFVLETLIHAKEKPTMLQWIELLTKQFNSCPAACEWFLDHMANDDWWPQQILIKCPNQVVRQMFHRLLIHVITQLKPAHVAFYLQPLFERDDEMDRSMCNEIGKKSCVTRFIKKMLSITQHGVKPHSKYLSEYFAFFLDFAKMGSEECIFLIQINTISTFINFYMGHKGQDYVEIISDDEEEDDDVIVVTEDKFRPTSLEKMITLISILVEETRVDGREVRLSDRDLNTLVGGKGFPFLFNQIRDNVNLRQTCNLIFSICRWNDRAAVTVVQMIFSAITSAKLNQEQSQPFFKVLSMLVEFIGGPPGMPNFTRYVLHKFWEVVEYCPQPCLEWLSAQVTRNKIIHSWVMQNLELWVELYLIAHNNPRVRNAAAYLLVSLIPSPGFRQAFRSSRHLLSPLKEMNQEAVDVLHAIYEHLLRLLNRARHFVDAATHGTNKLTSYFALMTYCLLSRAEKLMFSQYFMDLWQLFQPKLTEPPISMHHNKQALLIFWHQVCVDCPENVQLIVSNAHVTKNIAFNYILADHDDQEVVIFNRCMLPAYYGILRMCCQQSRSFTRQLAHHQNIQWAFKNITPYPAQYTAAVEELFKMMKLMVLRYPDTSEEELKSINHFKRNTLLLYLQNLDARSNWQTLIPALKTLVENGDDRMLLMYNNGLQMITEAFCTLHMMFHEATACHVTGDIVELLGIFPPVIKMARLFSEKKVGEAKQCLSNWKEKMELIRKLMTLLNSYTPPEVREAALNVLREMVLTFQNDAIQVILPIVISAHVQFQNNTPFAPGPYFPRRGQKTIGGLKSNIRPPRPQFQMLLHSSLLESAKGIDKAYDNALCEFFYPYHQFVDLMCRVAVNQQNLMEQLINLSAMAAFEGVPLHSPYFAKLWYEIYHLEHVDKNCVDILCKSSSFIDYVDSVLLDERQSLNNQFIFQFFTNYFPRVHQQVLSENGQALMDNIIQSISIEKVSLENTQCDDDILEITQKINGDLRALRLIFSVQPPKEMDAKLNEALTVILGICKLFQNRKQKEKAAQLEAAQTDETPAKKRKMSTDEKKEDEKEEDEKDSSSESRLDRSSPVPGTSSQKCDIENPDSENEDESKKGKMELKKLIPKEKPNSVDVVAKHIESLFDMVNKQKPST